jgi:rsbT antagonist protein RsbS
MPDVDEHAAQDTAQEPLRVSILRHGGHLVASIHTALDDGQLLRFRRELLDEIGRYRARGVVIDVAALDVIDSFACHTLRALAQVARLRGAGTVVVGIQPEVAMTMARLGTGLHPVLTALDLEEGLRLLDSAQPDARVDDPS